MVNGVWEAILNLSRQSAEVKLKDQGGPDLGLNRGGTRLAGVDEPILNEIQALFETRPKPEAGSRSRGPSDGNPVRLDGQGGVASRWRWVILSKAYSKGA